MMVCSSRITLSTREPQALQIMLYYDEVELCNPLGAAKNIHKVGMYVLLVQIELYTMLCMCLLVMISHRNVLLSVGKPFT